MQQIIDIERNDEKRDQQELFYKYINNNQPIIFNKFANDWVAIKKWTPEFLVDTIGKDHMVDVNKCSFGGFYRDIIQMKFSDYLNKSINDEFLDIDDKDGTEIFKINKPYLRNFEMFEDYPIFNQDTNNVEKIFKHDVHNVIVKRSFIGCKNSATQFHIDTGDNLVSIIHGTKYVILISPNEKQNIDYEKSRNIQVKYSDDDETGFKIESHPAFSKIQNIYTTTLTSGQSLFIPKGWVHYIHNLEYTLSVICMGKSLFE